MSYGSEGRRRDMVAPVVSSGAASWPNQFQNLVAFKLDLFKLDVLRAF